MQIYVCIKHVPDSAANIHLVNETTIDEKIAFLYYVKGDLFEILPELAKQV